MTLSAGTRLGPYEIVSKLGSGGMPASAVRATCDEAVMSDVPPRDWGDKSAWDSYFDTELHNNRRFSHPEPIVLRFLAFAREKGGRIWFPGCGLDHYPLTYARNGCRVVATDLSSVAVNYQRSLRTAFLKQDGSNQPPGAFEVAEGDFTQNGPDAEFDVVINERAFQGLAFDAMKAAARCFHTALRPGGACVLDTINVQGEPRNLIEDSLIEGGFAIPFQKTERWYRHQLDSSGIAYGFVMGRPRVIAGRRSSEADFDESFQREQQLLESFRTEYERRLQDEAADVEALSKDPRTRIAHVVYATG